MIYVATRKKDPNAVIDHTFDWSVWLAGDTITASDWTVPAGLSRDSRTFTALTTTVWLSGGTAGTNYEVVNRITTAGGRTEDRTLLIQCEER